MPPLPDRLRETASLDRKTAAWCDRAEELARDPAMTAAQAAGALAHLARLGQEVAARRLVLTRPLGRRMDEIRGWFAPLEDRIKAARSALSEAAVLVTPQAPHPDDLIEDEHRTDVTALAEGPETHRCTVAIHRAALDLEALRPYFTDHALKTAVARHGMATGQAPLSGVRQVDVVAGATLAVTVEGQAWTPGREG
ncbi:hypothetical protein HKCCSP123_02685 [Rhodobacterales bacterium HKCCSP123]|nr:hypothetical protein [Rhodobacterales bacterium HKCCSP123]